MPCDHWRDRDFLIENGWSASDLLDRSAALTLLRGRSGWHLYVLWSVTADATFPFYVGIGRHRRALRHQNPTARAQNPIKRAIWDRCIKAGGRILYSFPHLDLDHETAKKAECELIATIGRRMTGSGPLANLTEGGEGVIGVVHRRGGASPKAKPIIAEGRQFPSIHEAASELQLSRPCILSRLRNGWAGYCYPGEPPFPCRQGRKRGSDNPNSRAVVAEGVRYETASAAAAALGVHTPAVTRRITRGWPGYFYEDEGQRPQNAPHRKYPVYVLGTEYPDFCAASEATGIARQTIRSRVLAGAAGYSCANPAYI